MTMHIVMTRRIGSYNRLTTMLMFLGAMLLVSLVSSPASASHTCGPAPLPACGAISGLVPTHKDAVSASLIWGSKSDCPKMLIWMRPSEYTAQQFLNPPVGDGSTFPGFNQNYINLVQGGFGLGNLDRSGWSRYPPDVNKENTQLIDVCGLQSLIDTGVFTKRTLPEITNAEMALSEPFLKDAGYSRGLNYNLFCAGNVSGVDGRLYILGGHDKGGNNGIRKISIFDPVSERWLPRAVPCVKSEFEADPTGTAFPHCSALNEDNTDPPDPSDMKYQRWYNTGVTLPDGRILHLSGQDRDTSGGPGNALYTTTRPDVPEVYDPDTDRNVALENARLKLVMFPRAFPVQTGPKKNDWKVCATGKVIPPLPDDPGAPVNQIVSYDPFVANGETWCLDVLGALADPKRDIPANNHWQYVATSHGGAHYGGAAVRMVTINPNGTASEKAFHFGGNSGFGTERTAVAEYIDYSGPVPQWHRMSDLPLGVSDNNVVPLPDGKLLVVGGGAANQYEQTKHLQLYDPADGSRQELVDMALFRGDHSALFVVPNGGVWIMAGNRGSFLPGAENDLAVSTMEFYRPPYFFKGPRPVIEKVPFEIKHGKKFDIEVSTPGSPIGSIVILRTGPITHAWAWGQDYVKLSFTGKNKDKDKDSDDDDDDGKDKKKGKKNKKDKLKVMVPALPGLAIGGDYMLFAVSEDGIPSEGKHVFLQLSKKDQREARDDKGTRKHDKGKD